MEDSIPEVISERKKHSFSSQQLSKNSKKNEFNVQGFDSVIR